jgi:hypothetical protein
MPWGGTRRVPVPSPPTRVAVTSILAASQYVLRAVLRSTPRAAPAADGAHAARG